MFFYEQYVDDFLLEENHINTLSIVFSLFFWWMVKKTNSPTPPLILYSHVDVTIDWVPTILLPCCTGFRILLITSQWSMSRCPWQTSSIFNLWSLHVNQMSSTISHLQFWSWPVQPHRMRGSCPHVTKVQSLWALPVKGKSSWNWPFWDQWKGHQGSRIKMTLMQVYGDWATYFLKCGWMNEKFVLFQDFRVVN